MRYAEPTWSLAECALYARQAIGVCDQRGERVTIQGASGRAVRGDSEPSSTGEPGPGGLVILGSGVVILVGSFLPYAEYWDRGVTTAWAAVNGGGFVLWALPLVVSALVLIGSGAVYVAQNEYSRTSVTVSIVATSVAAIALVLGPGVLFLGQPEWAPMGLLPSGGGFSQSLGWGTWIMVLGTIGAFVGVSMAHGEQRSVASRRSSSQRHADPPLSSAHPTTTATSVPIALIGPASGGSAVGPLAPSASFFSGDEACKLIQRMVKAEALSAQRRGYRIVEAVWLSTSPPNIGVAFGDPEVRYRVKWPDRPTVNLETFRQGNVFREPSLPQDSPREGDTSAPSVPAASSHSDARASEPLTDGRRTKLCPDCAEMVYQEARICRFCRYDFADAAG